MSATVQLVIDRLYDAQRTVMRVFNDSLYLPAEMVTLAALERIKPDLFARLQP